MSETILLTIKDEIATIQFNRPKEMNTFNQRMGEELAAATEQVRLDQSIRAVLLKGAGPLFMAGGDILFFNQGLADMPKGVMNIVRSLNTSIINLMRMPKPVLASIHGSSAGVGISLMMACDLAIAADDTIFTMAYSGIGITPDGGASYHLPRLVGTKRAMEMLLLSEKFDAQTAKDYGLVNWTVPTDMLQVETQKIIQKLVRGPTQSYGVIKRLVNESWDNTLERQLELEGAGFELCSQTDDFNAGVKAFIAKKCPAFTGR